MNLKHLLAGSYNMQAISTTRVFASGSVQDTTARGYPPCIVVFGRPGAGKSSVADAAVAMLNNNSKKNSKNDIFCLGLDLDVCVPQWMRDNFAKGIYPTLQQREVFAVECCNYIEAQVDQTIKENKKDDQDQVVATIVSFSFVNTDLRDIFRSRFPHAKWVLVDTTEDEAQQRIEIRQGHFYKGAKSSNTNSEKQEEQSSKVDKNNDGNSEWKFAPVTFDHVVLDGTRTIEENAAQVAKLTMDEVSQSSCSTGNM